MYDIPVSYLDKNNQIVQLDGDGGDSFQRAGFVMIGYYLLHKQGLIDENIYINKVVGYDKRISKLENKKYPGVFARNNTDDTKWYAHYDRMSRDQITSNIVALGLIFDSDSYYLKRIILSNLTRAMLFTTNIRGNGAIDMPLKLPDFTGPSIWGMYIRATHTTLLKPFLYLTDLALLADSMIITYHKAKDPTNSDDLSFLSSLIQSQETMPTFLSKLAVKIYNKRPKTNAQSKSLYGPQTALDDYFAVEYGGCPVIADIFRPTLEKELSK